jgi:exopolysaccharide production protein ExoQ
MWIMATRLPSQWFDIQVGQGIQALEEGNPFDRSIFIILILLAIGILGSRSLTYADVFARNVALIAFLCFAFLSVSWSDYAVVAFKRWFRDLGNYLMILVILSDPSPLEAVRTVLRRLSYLVIPLSVLLIRYYPQISRIYNSWTGTFIDAGPTTGKNLLGVLAVISGVFFFWDTVTRWSNRKDRRTRWTIVVNIGFIGMTLWVVKIANSTTANVCLSLGCLAVSAAHGNVFRRRLSLLKMLAPAAVCLYVILAFGLGMNGDLAAYVGKDPTLTDRTKIWAAVLNMHTNPVLGTGYESFWMGPRLQWFWQHAGLGNLNEAHNGFLEVYLNLGFIGVSLLIGFLIASYRSICRALRPGAGLASLNLAFWTIAMFYNMTEAGFRSGLIWLTVLLGGIVIPGRTQAKVLAKSRTSLRSNRPERVVMPANYWPGRKLPS